VVVTSRPHDALFKAAFEDPSAAAALLRELLPPDLRDAIAWHTLSSERGSFIAPRLADHHTDLLFRARFRSGYPGGVVFLLEHQSTVVAAMPQRVLSCQLRIWERCRRERPRGRLPPVLAVVVSHAPDGWTVPHGFEELFEPRVLAIPGLAPLVPRCAMIVLDLAGLSNADLQARRLGAFQKLALWALRDARTPRRLLSNFEAWRPILERAGLTRSGRDMLAMLFEYLFRVVDPAYWKQLRARLRLLGPGAEGATMTIADMLIQKGRAKGLREGHVKGRAEGRAKGRAEGRAKGRAEGRAKGREEGRAEGRVASLRALLRFKFQSLDAATEARLRAASPAAIDRYLRRLLSADSLAAVFERGPRRRARVPRRAASRRRPRR
jgi:hypothetical protein